MERFKRNVDINSFHLILLSSYAISDQDVQMFRDDAVAAGFTP